MADPRVIKLADLIVNHSIDLQEGERVLISGTPEAADLIREVYRKCLQKGGIPITNIMLSGLNKIFLDEAKGKQLTDVEHLEWLYKHIDAAISIESAANTKELTNTNSEKLAIIHKAYHPLLQYITGEKIKWVMTQFPTNAAAQDAEMSLEEYEDFVYGAANVNYNELKETMDRAAELFNKANEVRIIANDTDITVDIEGREAVVSYGKHNIPDGEFYFTPNHLKTEGTIYFDWPTTFSGREIQGIRLVFKGGKVIEYSALKGQDYFEMALNTDEGSMYLGELGIGTNFGITKPTKNILFDEKIGGSVHLALGAAFAKAGKGNESAIHWDLVKGLIEDGEIYLDGNLVQKNGEWVF